MTTGPRTDPQVRLHAEVVEAHEQVRSLLEQAAAPAPSGDPRAPFRALDGALALLCEHLGAVEHVLHPTAARVLSDSRHSVTASTASTRRAQWALREVQQQLWGDTRAGHASLEELAQELRGVLEEHRAHDEDLARLLDDALDDDQREMTVDQLAEAARRAPTRPHPHLPHRGPAAGLVRRAAGWWDDVLDVLDVRRVEGRRAAPAPRPLGLWGSYLMGRSLPERPEQDSTASSQNSTASRDSAASRR